MTDTEWARRVVRHFLTGEDNFNIQILEIELEEKERERDEIEEEIAELEDKLEEAKEAIEDLRNVCPRCHLKQDRDPETLGLCCPKCGYCDLVVLDLEEFCDYHGQEEARA